LKNKKRKMRKKTKRSATDTRAAFSLTKKNPITAGKGEEQGHSSNHRRKDGTAKSSELEIAGGEHSP